MKKPKIRFKGYQEDWEQRKFGEIVQKYEDPVETPAEGYMRLGIRSHAKGTFHSYVEKGKELETAKMFRVAANNFIVNITFGWEHAVAITDESDAGKLVSHRFPQYSFKEGMNPRFFKYLILDECFRHHLELSSPGGAGRNRVLKLNEMLEYKMKFPQMEEQEEIAIYFEQLDNLITLHQRKCEETKTLKKYMLQKMFPQNGHSVPEIRFSGFTEDWEQRKLSELSEKTFGGGTPKTSNESFWKGNIPWIQSSDLIEGSLFDIEPRKYISQEAVDKSATKLVPENSVAIVTRVGVGKLAFMPFSYATSQDFLSLSVLKTEPQFTVYALYKKLQSELNAVQGTSIKGVTKNELLAKEIMIPCYEEQEKIGSYLHSLDHLITLHHRKYMKYADLSVFDWEQRKLGDVFEQTANFVNPNDDDIELWSLTVEDGLTPKSERYNREFLVKKKTNFKEVRPGDIVYNPMNMTLGAVGFNGMAKSVAVSGYYTTMVANKGYDSYYINTWLKSPQAISLYKTFATGSLKEKQRVQFPTLSIIPATFPEHDEQTKIGSYFEHLDHLITLHHRKQNYVLNTLIYAKTTLFITKTS